MPIIEHDPFTGDPVAAQHEVETGWGPALLEQHGLEGLRQEVIQELREGAPCLSTAGAGQVRTSTKTEGGVVSVTAWARCTRPSCVAYAAALDTLNTDPFRDIFDTPGNRVVLDAVRAQLSHPAMEFTDESDDVPMVWAYRTGVLRELLMYLTFQASTSAVPSYIRSAKEARALAAGLGLDLNGGPEDIRSLPDDPDVFERTARTLHAACLTLTGVLNVRSYFAPQPPAPVSEWPS
ncbi:hypothetical protein [Streptomyces sp. NPDC058758]|uniref:hypothetical protein n=1 Tax=Streptomyces sp. NPDC058758 TaxID=3346627 RepID=UPI0036CF1931